MARVAKSLTAPEHGYPHREHRSKKGRVPDHKFAKTQRIKKKRIEDRRARRDLFFQSPFAIGRVRKGKW